MVKLILVRHGITDWNREGRWHGQTDISINEEGRSEARKDAEVIKGYQIDKVYVSALKRTQETYDEIKQVLDIDVPAIKSAELNERDYGIYNGKNKWEVEKELGKEEFDKLRRGWDYPIPEGESLKQVYQRVVPYYQENILKDLKAGLNVMLVSSGNTLRALTKELDQLPDEEISNLQLNFGEVDIYTINEEGLVIGKQRLARDLFQGKH